MVPKPPRDAGPVSRPPVKAELDGRPAPVWAGPPVTPWFAAGDTSGKSRRLTARPAAQRLLAQHLLGQFFQRAVALVLPEDRDQNARDERARDRDEHEEARRRGHAKERSGDQDTAPGAEVAHAVGPAGAQRAHPGRVVLRDVHVHAP